MKIAPTILGAIVFFFNSDIETLTREPHPLKNWMLGSNIEVSLKNPIEDKTGREESFSPKVLGASELSNMQLTMSISVLFFLLATPLD